MSYLKEYEFFLEDEICHNENGIFFPETKFHLVMNFWKQKLTILI